MSGFGTSQALTIGQDHKTGRTYLVEPAPDVIYISEELLTEHRPELLQVSGSNLTFTLSDETLRYVIQGRSSVVGGNPWIAERVEDFDS